MKGNPSEKHRNFLVNAQTRNLDLSSSSTIKDQGAGTQLSQRAAGILSFNEYSL